MANEMGQVDGLVFTVVDLAALLEGRVVKSQVRVGYPGAIRGGPFTVIGHSGNGPLDATKT